MPSTSAPRLTLVVASRAHRVEPAVASDRELVLAFQGRDAGAGNAIWRKHAPMVFRLLGRALGPDVDVEDVAQDAFARVFARLRTLRDPDALQSFVYSVTLRTLRWEFRKRRARRFLQLWGDEEFPELAVNPLDVAAREALRRLYALLDTMSSEERMVFILRHMEGRKLEEIADMLAISLATTKRRLSRANRLVSSGVRSDPLLACYAPLEGTW